MTNSKELRALVARSGLKYRYIAKKVGLTPQSLSNKIKNKSEFKASEILKLCEVLHITDANVKECIFFNRV